MPVKALKKSSASRLAISPFNCTGADEAGNQSRGGNIFERAKAGATNPGFFRCATSRHLSGSAPIGAAAPRLIGT
jgi:hypothetical protein